jgi:hypothetical protein
MNTVQTFLKNLAADLVEKRLWPIAVVLIVGIVAVPVILMRGAEPAPSVTPTTPRSTGAGQTAQVALDTSAPQTRDRAEGERDPFAGKGSAAKASASTSGAATSTATPSSAAAPAVKSTASASGSASAPTGSSARGSGSSSSTPAAATPVASTTKTTTTSKPKVVTTPKAVDPSDTYHVTLRFGRTSDQRTIRDIARLTPLPSVENPFFVFLGVLQDGKTAVFMVSSDAEALGDGTCRPTPAQCETIELKAGDTEFFDVTGANGSVTQYQVDLTSVRRTEIVAAAKAAAAYERHSKAGAAMLRAAAVKGVGASAGARLYRYLPNSGVLVRAKRAKRARAAADTLVPGASDAVSLLPRSKQPGVAVWHSDESVKKGR